MSEQGAGDGIAVIAISLAGARMERRCRFWADLWHLRWFWGQVTLRRWAAQQMSACHEQIGERAGDDEAMSVLFEPAIAQLGEAEHPLDDPDRMLDFGPHLRLGAVFRPLDRVHDAAMAVAPVDEVLRLGCVPPDHRP